MKRFVNEHVHFADGICLNEAKDQAFIVDRSQGQVHKFSIVQGQTLDDLNLVYQTSSIKSKDSETRRNTLTKQQQKVALASSGANTLKVEGETKPDTGLTLPSGVIVTSSFVAVSCHHKIVLLEHDLQQVEHVIGMQGTTPGQFRNPKHMIMNQKGHFYVADEDNHRIQIFDSSWRLLSSFGSFSEMKSPCGITIDSHGRIIATDTLSNTILIYSPQGQLLKKFGQHGTKEGEINGCMGVTVDKEDIIYVCESDNGRVSAFNSDGQFLKCWGGLKNPHSISFLSDNSFIVTDHDSLVIFNK